MAETKEKKLVRGYFDGCFDVMHSGHFNALRQAKALCDVLVVGVHSDEEIARNKCAPVMSQKERYDLLKHIKWIDEIVHDVPYSPTPELIRSLNCDFAIHGDDMPVNEHGESAYDPLKAEGMLRVIKRTEGVSTTNLIGRMLALNHEPVTIGTKRKRVNDHGDENIEFTVSTVVKPKNPDRQMLLTSRRIAEFSPNKAPGVNDTIIYIDGSFDIFNVGIATLFENIKKELGGENPYLIVGIHDDANVQRFKGPAHPLQTMFERVLNVCACKHVDEVIIGAPGSITQDLLDTMNIKYVVVDEKKADCERYALAKEKGMLKVVKKPEEWTYLSVESITKRILENEGLYVQRNLKRDKTEDEYYKSKEQKKGDLLEN